MNTPISLNSDKPNKNIIYTTIKYAFAAVMAFLLVLVLGFEQTDYACKAWFLLSNRLLLLFWAVILSLWFLGNHIQENRRNPDANPLDYDRLVKWIAVLFLPVQIYIFYNAFFLTGWDAGAVREFAVQYISGDIRFSPDAQIYFSRYPNNILLLLISVVILRANIAFGIFTGEYTLMCCTVANCLISSLTCWLVYRSAGLFVKKSRAFLAYCLCLILVGLSPWNVIFYSDSVGLLFPILSFWLYYRPNGSARGRHISRFGAVLTAMVGYHIKPQCVIVLIAIVLLELAMALGRRRNLLQPLSLLAAAVLCFGAVSFAVETVYEHRSGLTVAEEFTFGPSHFVMMGLNEECGGVFSEEDYAFSCTIPTAEERSEANAAVTRSRLEFMGLSGTARHLCKKLLCAFNDGTFAWGVEGSFYQHIPQPLNSRSGPFFRSLYHHGGSLNPYFFQTMQFFWLGTLSLALLSVLKKHPAAQRRGVAALRLSVLGLVLYLALFEVRARYVYIYAPFFILLAVMGLEALAGTVRRGKH